MNQREEMNAPKTQGHVHELQGSVKVSEPEDPHSHRFCTVTGEVIPMGANDHVHEVAFLTDYHENHYHEFRGRTGGVIPVNDRHEHYLEAVTSVDDNHSHEFTAATMINNPIGDHKETAYYEDEYPYENEYRYGDENPYDEEYYQYREDNYQRF